MAFDPLWPWIFRPCFSGLVSREETELEAECPRCHSLSSPRLFRGGRKVIMSPLIAAFNFKLAPLPSFSSFCWQFSWPAELGNRPRPRFRSGDAHFNALILDCSRPVGLASVAGEFSQNCHRNELFFSSRFFWFKYTLRFGPNESGKSFFANFCSGSSLFFVFRASGLIKSPW